MKLYKYNLLILGMIAAVLSSCGDPDDAVFSGKSNEQTLVTFDRTSRDLPIVKEGEGDIDIQVDVTTKTDTDRSFNIALVDSLTQDTPNIDYDFENTVVIPAGEYTGSFNVHGVDQGLAFDSKNITFRIDETETESVKYESDIVTVKAGRTCPIPEDYFVGTYTVSDVSTSFGLFGDGQEVSVSIPEDNSSQRVFTATVLPGNSGPSKDIRVNLNCGFVVLGETIETNFTCQEDDDGNLTGPFISFGGVDNVVDNSTYSLDSSDQSFKVKYREDINGSCGATSEKSFKLTKTN